MDREGEEAEAAHGAAEPPPTEVVIAEAVVRTAGGTSPLAIFAGLLVLLIVSFGGAGLTVSGVGRAPTGASEPAPTPAQTPTATPAAARTPAPAAAATSDASEVRVTRTGATSRAIAGGNDYEVTFTWTLEGARENDQAVIQFYAGTRALGQQRGTLDPAVFKFSTGTLTLTAALECSATGWTAELLTVRGRPVEGDAEATAAGVQCR